MSSHQEVLREARERWMEGDAAALTDFERGIGLAARGRRHPGGSGRAPETACLEAE